MGNWPLGILLLLKISGASRIAGREAERMRGLTMIGFCDILFSQDLSPKNGFARMWEGLDKLLELQKLDWRSQDWMPRRGAIPQTIATIEGRLASGPTGI